MTHLLATTIVRGSAAHETSGYLYVVDLEERAVAARSPIMEAPLRDGDPNPRGGMRGGRGLAVNGDEIFVANFSAVYRFDADWRLLNVISHPACADIHDITFHDGSLWVTSTRNDLILQFSPEGRLLDHIDVHRFDVVVELHQSNPMSGREELLSGAIDFRDPRTHNKDGYDTAHVNAVTFGPEGDLIVLLGQTGRPENPISALLSIDENGVASVPLALGDAIVPRHNALFLPEGDLVLSDTPQGELVHVAPISGSELSRTKLQGGYLRGLVRLDDGRLVVGQQEYLVILGASGQDSGDRIRLSSDSRESVHSIEVLADSFAAMPGILAIH